MESQGHRIGRAEMAEIEMTLLTLDGVNQAVVIIREDSLGAKQLIAYIFTALQPSPSASELQSLLSGKLPKYLIPSYFEITDEMPPVSYMVSH